MTSVRDRWAAKRTTRDGVPVAVRAWLKTWLVQGQHALTASASNRSIMKIALGVTGGIAAYKAAEIVRLLQDRGVRVQVVMTEAAQEFVRPLTFAALSGEKVITGMFAAGGETAEPRLRGRAHRGGAVD